MSTPKANIFINYQLTYEISIILPLLITINSLILCIYKPPILILASIIIQAFIICVLLKSLFKTAWFSLILFLIFVGGLIILFIYIISLASNNEITFNRIQINYIKFIAVLIITLLFSIMAPSTIKINSSINQINLTYFLNKIYSLAAMTPISIVILYLLLVLLITVSVALLKRGPLRRFTKIK